MDLSIQTDLSYDHNSFQKIRFQNSGSRKYCSRHRQIKTGSFLFHIGRCKIYSYFFWWQTKPVVLKCSPDSFLGLSHLGRGKSYHSKRRQTITDICLNLDLTYFHSVDRC